MSIFSFPIKRCLLDDKVKSDTGDYQNENERSGKSKINRGKICPASPDSNSSSFERIRRKSLNLLLKYPDRQRGTFETDSRSSDCGEENDKDKIAKGDCAAGSNCFNALDTTPPSHRCSICKAPVQNLCNYGKRVLKDFSRKLIYACSKECFNSEKGTLDERHV